MRKMASAFLLTVLAVYAASAGQTREQTTIQSVTARAGGQTGAVEVRYLNIPWGETTFRLIETGSDNYYGKRPWPFAHLTTRVPLKAGSSRLAPGDYVLVLHPGGPDKKMELSIEAFSPGEAGTFLKAGDVFVNVPEDARSVYRTQAVFARDQNVADHMRIELAPAKEGLDVMVFYGDRRLSIPLETSK